MRQRHAQRGDPSVGRMIIGVFVHGTVRTAVDVQRSRPEPVDGHARQSVSQSVHIEVQRCSCGAMRAPEWQPLRNGVAIVRLGLGKPMLQVISVVPAHNAFRENPGHDGSRGDPYVVEERSEDDPGQRCRQLHRVPDIAVDPRRDQPPRRVE